MFSSHEVVSSFGVLHDSGIVLSGFILFLFHLSNFTAECGYARSWLRVWVGVDDICSCDMRNRIRLLLTNSGIDTRVPLECLHPSEKTK